MWFHDPGGEAGEDSGDTSEPSISGNGELQDQPDGKGEWEVDRYELSGDPKEDEDELERE